MPLEVRAGDGDNQIVDVSAGEMREIVGRKLQKHDRVRLVLDEVCAPAPRRPADLQRPLLRVERPFRFKGTPGDRAHCIRIAGIELLGDLGV